MMRRLLYVSAGVALFCGVAEAAGPLDGRWVNVDPHTRGVVRLSMHGSTLHAYGACHPTLCDWGKTEGGFSDDSAQYTSQITDDVGRRTVTITMDDGKLLRMRVQTRYADGRFGPEDSVEISVFRRVRRR